MFLDPWFWHLFIYNFALIRIKLPFYSLEVPRALFLAIADCDIIKFYASSHPPINSADSFSYNFLPAFLICDIINNMRSSLKFSTSFLIWYATWSSFKQFQIFSLFHCFPVFSSSGFFPFWFWYPWYLFWFWYLASGLLWTASTAHSQHPEVTVTLMVLLVIMAITLRIAYLRIAYW